jgi:RNA polymerase sigma-70 factor, ECF subfamily
MAFWPNLESRTMAGKTQAITEERDPKPGTLGEVLYTRGGAQTASEGEWVGLVQAISAGDQLALHELYERAHRPVFTLVMRISNNRLTAEELTMDVFLEVWRRAPQYEPTTGGSVLGWILNQARSRAIDRVRFESRLKRLRPESDEWRQWTPPRDSEAAVTQRQEAERVRKALTVLTPEERRVIESAYFSGLTYGEVAERLNQSLGTVKTRIRSGLAKLREALASGKES